MPAVNAIMDRCPSDGLVGEACRARGRFWRSGQDSVLESGAWIALSDKFCKDMERFRVSNIFCLPLFPVAFNSALINGTSLRATMGVPGVRAERDQQSALSIDGLNFA